MGLLTHFPSITLFSLTLGPTNSAPITVEQKTLVFRRGCFSHPLSLLMSAFALVISPEHFSISLHRPTQRSSTAYIFYINP